MSSKRQTNVDVIYLDFAKAFDKDDHGILLNKFNKIGISGKVGEWLPNVLADRQEWVAVNGATSEAQDKSGIPQGSVLLGLCYSSYIYHINYEIADSRVSCFADDTPILLEIKY